MINSKLISFFVVFGITGAVYAFTLCPTVEFIDSGELALACKYLGIAHPTGYPLYTLLGRLATMIFRGDLIFRVNLLSLLLTASAAGFLAITMTGLTSFPKRKNRWTNLVACSASIIAALSPVWWAQGTTNEVYSLNLLLISVLILFFLKYLRTGKDAGRWLLLAGYIFGLSLTNHLSALYLLPGFIIILGIRLWKRQLSAKILIWLAAFSSFPLILYLLLPIRASFSPFLNWGGVDDSYFLYKHITGWQYRIWMFSDSNLEIMGERLIYSGKLILTQFGWFGLIAGFFGLYIMIAKQKTISLFLSLIIFFNLIYVANYQIADIDSYYLPMIIAISLFMARGLFFVISRVLESFESRRLVRIVLAALLIALPLLNFVGNFFQSNRGNRTFARQGAVDLVKSMEPGALALVENWDFYAPWLYLYYEEQYHPEIVIFDKELMRRSWYIEFIKRYHTEIYSRSKGQIDEFLRQVKPFERDKPFDPNVIDRAYYQMLKAIIDNESALRPVYTNVVGDPKFIKLLRLVPDGILFRVYNSADFLNSPLYEFDRSYWGNRFIHKDARVGQLLAYYRRAFQARERYCRRYGKPDEAEHYQKLSADVSAVISSIKE
ncbi:MAG: DUF2723 domain-containing protein [candidate division Zixibacteria bacterium]